MFENIKNFCKRIIKRDEKKTVQESSRNAAKERLHLVLMQDRANVSADFLELMKQEIIEVIKKYIEVDEKEIDVRLTNKENQDGTNGAPALYANIPILNIKNDAKKVVKNDNEKEENNKQIEENEKEQEKEIEANSSNNIVVEKDKEEVENQQTKEQETKQENNSNKENK